MNIIVKVSTEDIKETFNTDGFFYDRSKHFLNTHNICGDKDSWQHFSNVEVYASVVGGIVTLEVIDEESNIC